MSKEIKLLNVKMRINHNKTKQIHFDYQMWNHHFEEFFRIDCIHCKRVFLSLLFPKEI